MFVLNITSFVGIYQAVQAGDFLYITEGEGDTLQHLPYKKDALCRTSQVLFLKAKRLR
jgi:hypothetical protein